jgi:hypothetical protein
MPRAAKKKTDIDPEALYVAWQAGSADIDGITYSVTSGEHRRGSDPLVQHHRWLFVEDGVPESERRNEFHQIVERHEAEQPPPGYEVQLAGVLPTPLEVEDTIRLLRAVAVRAGYPGDLEMVQYEQGTIFPARSEVTSLLPEDAHEHTEIQFTRAAKGRRR